MGVAPLEVQFTDISRGSPEKWCWDFGDGSESDLQSPLHVYNKPGTYTVKLTVSNKTTKAVEEREIVVYPGDANFTANNLDVSEDIRCDILRRVFLNASIMVCSFHLCPIQFTDKSSGKPISWAWNFGDGERSSEQNPVHFYTAGGRYTVTLIVTYDNMYTSTEKKSKCIVIMPDFLLDVLGRFPTIDSKPVAQLSLPEIEDEITKLENFIIVTGGRKDIFNLQSGWIIISDLTFLVVTKLDKYSYEIICPEDSDEHGLLTTMGTEYTSKGRARAYLLREGCVKATSKDGFPMKLNTFTEISSSVVGNMIRRYKELLDTKKASVGK